jgi:hypothetical protein
MSFKDPPVAFVDESYIHRANHPGIYLMSAVIVLRSNLRAMEHDAMRTAARVGDATGSYYHTTGAYRRGHLRQIQDMLDVIDQHAEWTLLTACTPITDTLERARQHTLARLLVDLDRSKVTTVTMESRSHSRQWRRPGDPQDPTLKLNRLDQRTLRVLRHAEQVSDRIQIVHRTGAGARGLWLADAAAWAARRVLAHDDPQWWFRIAGTASVIHATTGAQLQLTNTDPQPAEYQPFPAVRLEPLTPTGYAARPVTTPPTVAVTYTAMGPFMDALLQQTQAAREPSVVLPASLAGRLLNSVQRLTDDVAQLRKAITQQRTDHLTAPVNEVHADTELKPDQPIPEPPEPC